MLGEQSPPCFPLQNDRKMTVPFILNGYYVPYQPAGSNAVFEVDLIYLTDRCGGKLRWGDASWSHPSPMSSAPRRRLPAPRRFTRCAISLTWLTLHPYSCSSRLRGSNWLGIELRTAVRRVGRLSEIEFNRSVYGIALSSSEYDSSIPHLPIRKTVISTTSPIHSPSVCFVHVWCGLIHSCPPLCPLQQH